MPREGWLAAVKSADVLCLGTAPFPHMNHESVQMAPAREVETWDAGPMGCGELVMRLRVRLKAMPGQVLRVIALDAGAPEDLPAWCRMTRNDLVRDDPRTHSYWIRSRTDWS